MALLVLSWTLEACSQGVSHRSRRAPSSLGLVKREEVSF